MATPPTVAPHRGNQPRRSVRAVDRDNGLVRPSPLSLADTVGVQLAGSAPWGVPIRAAEPGIYIVSLDRDPAGADGLPTAPIDVEAVDRWLSRVPAMRLAGEPVTSAALAAHLQRWWLSGTSVLYIGKASSVRKRVHQYVKTPLGAPGPHAGGHWLKVLRNLPALTVHYATLVDVATAEAAEDAALAAFLTSVEVPAAHPEPALPLPWAKPHPGSAAPPAPPHSPARAYHDLNSSAGFSALE